MFVEGTDSYDSKDKAREKSFGQRAKLGLPGGVI